MRQTYAVTWSKDDGHVYAGQLDLQFEGLTLRGGSGTETVVEQLAYDELGEVRRARSVRERVRGHASLVLELLSGGEISIASLGQPGALSEVADRLSAACV